VEHPGFDDVVEIGPVPGEEAGILAAPTKRPDPV
jgi:hypothetical protein